MNFAMIFLFCVICTILQSQIILASFNGIPVGESNLSIVSKCLYNHLWLADQSHHCHIVAYGAGKRHFTSRELALRSLFQAMIVRSEADRQLVEHCTEYHLFDRSYKPCRGINWAQAKHPNLREAYLLKIRKQYQQETKRKIARRLFLEGRGSALVAQCLSTIEWLTKETHPCHEVAYGGGTRSDQFTGDDLKLQSLYRKERYGNTVADCYYHHRQEALPKCYGITWTARGQIDLQDNRDAQRFIEALER